jgi:hypothetical protein
VLNRSPVLELVSSSPMALDNAIIVTSQVADQQIQYYDYKGFHLLTFNEGRYYFFKDIDPITCKPSQVYVIDADRSIQVRLFPPVSLVRQCKRYSVRQSILPTIIIPTIKP